MAVSQSLFSQRPVYKPQTITVKDALTEKHFNAMYQYDANKSDYNHCGDALKAELLRKNVLDGIIRCGNSKPVDFNFFRILYGQEEQLINTKTAWNMYDTEEDYNILFQSSQQATAAGAGFWVTLLRDNHSAGGKSSFAAKGFQLLDKENMVWYSIEDKDDARDYAHRIFLKPQSATIVGSVKQYKKYLVVPARMVRGSSCPLVTNEMPTVPWMQKIGPVRFRRDWELEIDLLRGTSDQLMWTILYDQKGNPIDAWDTYQMVKAREGLQQALNLYAFTGNPITNTDFINGVTTMVVDDVHTGFYGYMPTLKYGGGNVLDYDPGDGISLATDLKPHFLSQDALKRTNSFTVLAGLPFIATFTDAANGMIRLQGNGMAEGPVFQRNGGNIAYNAITSYEWLGKRIDVKLWDALNDARYLGSPYFDNVAIMSPNDGVMDVKGASIKPITFYQYGNNGETGGYEERTIDRREIDGCEWMKGYCAQSEMMAFHCPNQHTLIQPVSRC